MLINGNKIVENTTQSPADEFILCGNLTAATSTAVGGVLKIQNTYGYDLIITRMIIDVITKSTGAATVDIGVDATGTTSSDNIIDGLDVAVTGISSNLTDSGTNGGMVVWGKDKYVVATASATVAGLVGKYKIYAVAR